MAAPIRSQAEIDTIINNGNHTIADLGLDLIEDGKRGVDLNDVDFRDKAYRLILLRAYLKNILDPITAETKLYYTASDQEKTYNKLLDAIAQLSFTTGGPGIPLIRGKRIPLFYYPSSSGPSSGGNSSSGGPATPGGVTFQNLSIDAPGEVVDSMDASANEYAFYIIQISGTNSGEGSRLDLMGVNWRNGSTPVITNYGGDVASGSIDPALVYWSAAINLGQMELTLNVPTDNWAVKGTRISFENVSFQNAQGPLPTGGTAGQILEKASSTDYDAQWVTAVSQTLDAGTYTPTLTNVLNISSSTAFRANYSRVGNIVTVSGKASIDITNPSAATILGISLPIASNLTNAQEANGTAVVYSGTVMSTPSIVEGNPPADNVVMVFISSADVSDNRVNFIFTYEVI